MMDATSTEPRVWDPGASLSTSCQQLSREIALTKPATPPPPSANSIENIISNTLNRIQKSCLDSKNGVTSKNASDLLEQKLMKDNELVDFIPPTIENEDKTNIGIKSEYVELDFEHSKPENLTVKREDLNSKGNKFQTSEVSEIVSGNLKGIKNDSSENRGNDVSEVELTKMLDLFESYNSSESETLKENTKSDEDTMWHKPKFACVATNTTDSLHRRKMNRSHKENVDIDRAKSNNLSLDSVVPVKTDAIKKDTSALYAMVDKNRPRKPTPEKEIQSNKLPPEPPPVPPKPQHLLETSNSQSELRQAPSQPEIQVMLNSLSPVLLRRNNTNRSHRKPGSSAETSPDNTPDVSPRLVKDDFGREICHQEHRNADEKVMGASLFMDPEMSKTWHGTTGSDWSQYYGPQLRAMMKELSRGHQLDQSVSSSDDLHFSGDEYNSKSKTLPSKSLLDEMHKKYCADQYMDERDKAMIRELVLFRLKSQPPLANSSKSRRSQSFNIRMGMGATLSRKGANKANLSASANSSPLFPRSHERLRIKTRPDAQYSPRPLRTRGVTPEATVKIDESQCSQKEEAEIEAIEACRWLRETGFPQYAQLYEDGQFPVDIESVEKDHDFLDKEDIQSLFRRLNTLNKCAIMKIGTPSKKDSEESDEEEQCALSDKWKYQRSSRRWSRKDLDCPGIENLNGQSVLKSSSSHDSLLAGQNSSSETGDSPVLDSKMLHAKDDMVFKTSGHVDANGNSTAVSPKVIRRAASERIKGAKSFLKRMESLKGKRTRKNKTITEISGPVVADKADMQAKIKHLNCRDISGGDDINANNMDISHHLLNGDRDGKQNLAISSPELVTLPRTEALTVVTAKQKQDSSVAVTPTSYSASKSDITRNSLDISTDTTSNIAHGAPGLDLSTLSQISQGSDTTTSSEDTVFGSVEYRPGKFPKLLDESLFSSDSNHRARSFSYADDKNVQDTKRTRRGSHDPRKQINRMSIYDNVPVEEDLATAQQELDIILSELFQNINGLNKAIYGENAETLEPPSTYSFLDDSTVSTDSQGPEKDQSLVKPGDVMHHDESEIISGTLSSPDISDLENPTEDMSHDDSTDHIVVRERRDSGVGSSLTRANSERKKYRIRWHSFQKSHRPTSETRNLQLYNLSAGQILVLRKLSLLKLTALMEKYAPNRSGWSLTVPRFMKRNKVPDYRDKNVFGVPFSVIIQRTGQPLPQCILHALRFLRRTGGDALGIFRKSGVRSRIQKLRNDIEADPESVDFEELQAYDVADLVKQYFRELPECLLTNKLSDIFISIFIYVPSELRLEAIQAAIVLMTDENRDVLQSLLLFLSDIAKCASKHQMTASNLAVCFAPSLFNMGGTRNASLTPSPRRNRKNAPGIPDARELMEQKAGHECLTFMIQECKKLFTIPAMTLSKCRVVEDPITLEQLNRQSENGNKGYSAFIDDCIQGLLKESREKFRGWISAPVDMDIDVSYKKVGDGHPLRLWKCTVDVEAPPNEVLNRILNDRQKWDEDLLQWSSVEKLDDHTEVFQYVRNSMAPHPTREYCVLRSWKSDLPRGACVLISTSIDHEKAEPVGGVRGVELASRYLIEPCGTGKSRLTHVSRVDLRGHSPEWYKKVFGHICANFMDRIRASFHNSAEGPETKV